MPRRAFLVAVVAEDAAALFGLDLSLAVIANVGLQAHCRWNFSCLFSATEGTRQRSDDFFGRHRHSLPRKLMSMKKRKVLSVFRKFSAMKRILRAGLKDVRQYRLPTGISLATIYKGRNIAQKRIELMDTLIQEAMGSFARVYGGEIVEEWTHPGTWLPEFPKPSKDPRIEGSRMVSRHLVSGIGWRYESSHFSGDARADAWFDNYRPGEVPTLRLEAEFAGTERFCGRESDPVERVATHFLVPIYEDILVTPKGREYLEKAPMRSYRELVAPASKAVL